MENSVLNNFCTLKLNLNVLFEHIINLQSYLELMSLTFALCISFILEHIFMYRISTRVTVLKKKHQKRSLMCFKMRFPSAEAQANSGDGCVYHILMTGSGFNLDVIPARGAEKLFWTHHCQVVWGLLNQESNGSTAA